MLVGIFLCQRNPQQPCRSVDRQFRRRYFAFACRMVIAYGLCGTHHQHQQIIRLRRARVYPHFLPNFFPNFRGCLGKPRLDALEIFEHARSTLRNKERLDVVALLARKFTDMWNADGNHWQIAIDGELLQIGRRKTIGHVCKCRQAQVGLVDAVLPDSIVVIHARKRRLDLMPRRFEGGSQETLYHFPNPLRLRIGHFEIDLGEFGLAVGAQVFVAETAHNLEIFIEARDH